MYGPDVTEKKYKFTNYKAIYFSIKNKTYLNFSIYYLLDLQFRKDLLPLIM